MFPELSIEKTRRTIYCEGCGLVYTELLIRKGLKCAYFVSHCPRCNRDAPSEEANNRIMDYVAQEDEESPVERSAREGYASLSIIERIRASLRRVDCCRKTCKHLDESHGHLFCKLCDSNTSFVSPGADSICDLWEASDV